MIGAIADCRPKLERAVEDRVRYIVYTSLTSVGDHLTFALAHRWTERRLAAGPIPFTILRNGLYAELIGQLATPRDGVITAPFGDSEIAAVARDDLAEAAALIALHATEHKGRIYDLIASEPFTVRQIAETIGAAYAPMALKDLRIRLGSAGLQPFQPAMLHSIHTATSHGFLSSPGTDLEAILNRKPAKPLPIAASAALPQYESH